MSATVKLGDAYQLLNEIPDHSVDLIFTDPPYNLDEYATEIQIEGRENLSKTADWDRDFKPSDLLTHIPRILKPTGNFLAFTSFNMFGDWHRTYDPLFDTFQFFSWVKDNPPPSFRKSSFLNGVEQIICCWDKGHTWNFKNQAEMKNWLSGPICMGKERVKGEDGKTLHPTQKPLYLLRHLIEIASNPKDLVLDPFGGVMSTGVAAVELGRRFIGFEKNPTYFEVGKKRLEGTYPEIRYRF